MLVKELIEKLQTFDPDMRVVINHITDYATDGDIDRVHVIEYELSNNANKRLFEPVVELLNESY